MGAAVDGASDEFTSRIRREHPVPLYHQIFLELRDEILCGKLPDGASVPTELELAALYGVSRITARRALHELSCNNLVERRRRTGTRVTFRPRSFPLETNVDQAFESLIAFGRVTRVDVMDLIEEPADARIAALLDRPEKAPMIRARRIRHLDREPLGLVTSWLPRDLGITLTDADLVRAPMLDLLRNAGLHFGGGRQTISAFHASPELAATLKIEPRAALLRIERIVADANERPVLATIADYRADRYRISFGLNTGPQVELSPSW